MKKINSISDFKKYCPQEYGDAHRQQFIESICNEMGWKFKKPNGYWVLDKCREEALKYNNISEWQINGNASYKAAYKNGWVKECSNHMIRKMKPKGYWTKESCKTISLTFTTKVEWHKFSYGSYQAAYSNGWMEECCAHMNETRKQPNYWTLERCKEEALKYKNRLDWMKNNGSSHTAAYKNGWIDECCKHMSVRRIKPKGYWTKERCLEYALKYKNKVSWIEGNVNSYNLATKNGWIDECCKHMTDMIKPKGYWTKERCLEDALKYNTKKDWKNNSSAHNVAYKNGWMEECCAHLKYFKRK